jgi:hypothetical protein
LEEGCQYKEGAEQTALLEVIADNRCVDRGRTESQDSTSRKHGVALCEP